MKGLATTVRGNESGVQNAVAVRVLIALLVSACGASSPPAGTASTAGGEQAGVRKSQSRSAPELLGGPCQVEPVSPSLARVHCTRYELRILRPSSLHAGAIDAHLSKPPWVRGEAELGGRTVPVGRFNADGEHGDRLGLAVLSEISGRAYVLSCFSGRDQDPNLLECQRVLSNVLEHGLPVEIRFADASLSIGDKTLRVPDGCQFMEEAARIRCPEAELHFRDRSPGMRIDRVGLRSLMAQGLAGVGSFDQTEIPCRVLGQDQTCDLFEVDQSNGARLKVIVALAEASGAVVQCNLVSDERTDYPEPCDQVFEGRP